MIIHSTRPGWIIITYIITFIIFLKLLADFTPIIFDLIRQLKSQIELVITSQPDVESLLKFCIFASQCADSACLSTANNSADRISLNSNKWTVWSNVCCDQTINHKSMGRFKTTKAFYEYVLAPDSNSPGLTVKNTEASKSPTENMSPRLLRWIWGNKQRNHIISSEWILKSRFFKSQVKTNEKGRCCCSVLIHTESLSVFLEPGADLYYT